MRKLVPGIALSLMLVGSGCNGRPDGTRVVARVNGIEVTAEDVAFRPADPQAKQEQEKDRLRYVEEIINEELLCQKAVQLGLDVDDRYGVKKRALDQMSAEDRRRELAKRVFNTQIAAGVAVTQPEAQAYYDDHRKEIETELHLELLTFDKRSAAELALVRVKGGASFSSVALDLGAVGPELGKSPWDLGFLRWEEIPVEFLAEIYRLKPGENTEIIGNHQTRFQIVKLLETRKGTRRDFASVSANLTNRLRQQKLKETYKSYLNELRKQAKIKTY